jgi:hypothetical protein
MDLRVVFIGCDRRRENREKEREGRKVVAAQGQVYIKAEGEREDPIRGDADLWLDL